jgi:Hsp70 protein
MNDRVEIIANDQGNRTTPSYVAFTDTERLIGDAAKNQVAMNPRNTVFDAKRLIGRHFSEPVVQEDMRHWSFTVKAGQGDKPFIEGALSLTDCCNCPGIRSAHYSPSPPPHSHSIHPFPLPTTFPIHLRSCLQSSTRTRARRSAQRRSAAWC